MDGDGDEATAEFEDPAEDEAPKYKTKVEHKKAGTIPKCVANASSNRFNVVRSSGSWSVSR